MSKNNDSGHAKNVANFETMISFITALGDKYAPTKSTIQLNSLNQTSIQARSAIDAVAAAKNIWTIAVSEREILYKGLGKLVTRVINAFESSDVQKELVTDAKSIVRKLQGKRAVPLKETNIDNGTNTTADNSKNNSAAQTSFDNRLEYFGNLVDLLKENPAYNPNEIDLKTTSLTEYLVDLKTKNNNVVNTYTALSNSRIARNKILYNEVTGVFTAAKSIKKYIKSVFDAKAPEYKQISGLRFVNLDLNK